jgi:hypothetical protein
VGDANRASEVIQRIRALAKRSEPQMVSLDINLVQREVLGHGVSLRTELVAALPRCSAIGSSCNRWLSTF